MPLECLETDFSPSVRPSLPFLLSSPLLSNLSLLFLRETNCLKYPLFFVNPSRRSHHFTFRLCCLVAMFGFSYGELFLLLGGTAALIGPKDLPVIARTIGRLAGRSIGYVQMARGQFENVMQQSQANQVHKELQDTMAQLEAIRHEIRSISIMNPGPLTRRLVDNPELTSANNGDNVPPKLVQENVAPKLVQVQSPPEPISKESGSTTSTATNLHSQATAYERLAESQLKNDALKGTEDVVKPGAETDLFNILPVSAESAGLLPNRNDDAKGSDIMLEAVLEAEVAQNAKQFFAQHQDQLKVE